MASNQMATCEFISSHATEIAKLADEAQLQTLSYLAKMLAMQAQIEIHTMIKKEPAAA